MGLLNIIHFLTFRRYGAFKYYSLSTNIAPLRGYQILFAFYQHLAPTGLSNIFRFLRTFRPYGAIQHLSFFNEHFAPTGLFNIFRFLRTSRPYGASEHYSFSTNISPIWGYRTFFVFYQHFAPTGLANIIRFLSVISLTIMLPLL